VLILVLLLIVVAFGLLIATLVLAQTLLAWVSVGISALAALLLIIDAIRRSRARSWSRRPAPPVRQTAEPDDADEFEDEYGDDEYDEDELDFEDDLEEDAPEPAGAQPAGAQPAGREDDQRLVGEHDYWADLLGYTTQQDAEDRDDARPEDERPEDEPEDLVAADEPSVEPTPESDLAALAELTDEVVVVDERPRYHLASCDWLGELATLPLPVYEARELGFSPCAVCTPDASLLARHRA
jgi:hypothetical protein